MIEKLYILFSSLAPFIFRIGSIFNEKMKRGYLGRKLQTIESPSAKKPVLWMHCASVGEFEQGLPLLQMSKSQYHIIVSFFSPSGYQSCANNTIIDKAYYLPLDTAANAKFFISTINPSMAVFVKYEIWYHYLHQLYNLNIPTYLISAHFTENASYFNLVLKSFYTPLFHKFSGIFAQEESSKNILASNGIENVKVVGDTRLDRVVALSQETFMDQKITDFVAGRKVLIAGSTWPEDYTLLQNLFAALTQNWCLLIVPHEVKPSNIMAIESLFTSSVRYTELNNTSARVCIVNVIGKLSKLYRFAELCYIGGGFGAGIHNTLEAVVYYKPLIFGPNYQRFQEAKYFIENGIASEVNEHSDWENLIDSIGETATDRHNAIIAYINANKGATQKIFSTISAKN